MSYVKHLKKKLDGNFGVIILNKREDMPISYNVKYKELKAAVRKVNLHFAELGFTAFEDTEPETLKSLLVFNISEKQLIAIGQRFDQNKFIIKNDFEIVVFEAASGAIDPHLTLVYKFDLINESDIDISVFLNYYLKLINHCLQSSYSLNDVTIKAKVPLSFNEVAYLAKKPEIDETWYTLN